MHTTPPLAGLDAAFERLLVLRHSCRAFVGTPVPKATIEAILSAAQHTPSWNNVQPWHVIVTQPAATERLRAELVAGGGEGGGFEIPPPAEYKGAYHARRRACGWGLYESVGIRKGDREASARQAAENYRFFGAPHVAIVTTDRLIGSYGLVDCGAWVNNFMLAAASHGVATIAQAALAHRSAFLRRWFAIPEDRQVVCGVSFGYADADHPANGFRTARASLDETTTWVED